jgi:hypothetical protein
VADLLGMTSGAVRRAVKDMPEALLELELSRPRKADSPEVRDVLQLVGALRRAGYTLQAPDAHAPDMDCPGCERRGMLSKTFRMPRTGVFRTIVYCRACRAGLMATRSNESPIVDPSG